MAGSSTAGSVSGCSTIEVTPPAAAARAADFSVSLVSKPGSPVFVLVWGRAERTELAAILDALRRLLPPAPPNAPGPFALSEKGALEALVRQAALEPIRDGYLEAPFEFRDRESLLRANLASGPATLAIRTSGEDAVREAVLEAFAPFRTAHGGYRIETEWRYVTAEA